MKIIVVTFCLIGAVFASPIFYNVDVGPNGLETNMTLSESDSSQSQSESSESNTSELQSSEEDTSNQSSNSSESESLESTSEDTTSEESDSQSDEDMALTMGETQDNSLGSEENLRKGWIRGFASVISVLSAEDNSSSTEVKVHPDELGNKGTKASGSPPSHGTAFRWKAQGNTNLTLMESNTDSSDASDSAAVTDATSQSSDSTSSESSDSTSSESDQTVESIDSSKESSQESSKESSQESSEESVEEGNASDSAELEQLKATECAQGADSTGCHSEEEDFFQVIGDDAHHPAGHLMAPEEDERELSLRR